MIASPGPPAAPPPDRSVEAGSQALSEALRSSFGILKVLVAILFVVFLGSGVFKVGPDERAIKLRLGKVVGQGQQALLRPGLHWSFPYPIEEYKKVSVSGYKQARSSIGWYNISPEQEAAGTEPPAAATLNPAQDGYVLTADDNIIHTRATLTYHVADPVAFVFNFNNATNTIRNALDNALLFAAAQFKVDEILTSDVLSFRDAVRKRATDLIEAQNLGVVIDNCAVQSRWPRQVNSAFVSVIEAEFGRSKARNSAISYAVQVTNSANADASSLINFARSARVSYVNDVAAQARRFQEILPKFRQNPGLFTEKNLVETIGRVFTNADYKIFVAQGSPDHRRGFRPFFNLPLPKPKTE